MRRARGRVSTKEMLHQATPPNHSAAPTLQKKLIADSGFILKIRFMLHGQHCMQHQTTSPAATITTAGTARATTPWKSPETMKLAYSIQSRYAKQLQVRFKIKCILRLRTSMPIRLQACRIMLSSPRFCKAWPLLTTWSSAWCVCLRMYHVKSHLDARSSFSCLARSTNPCNTSISVREDLKKLITNGLCSEPVSTCQSTMKVPHTICLHSLASLSYCLSVYVCSFVPLCSSSHASTCIIFFIYVCRAVSSCFNMCLTLAFEAAFFEDLGLFLSIVWSSVNSPCLPSSSLLILKMCLHWLHTSLRDWHKH